MTAPAVTSPDASIAVPARVAWQRGEDPVLLQTREWMVTNGLGGYAAGTLSGVPTRRSHGLLIASLPAPLGRTSMLTQLLASLRFDDGETVSLLSLPPHEIRLVNGRPYWRWAYRDAVLEVSVVMPYRQNTTFISYRLLPASPSVVLILEPAFDFRPHEGPVAGGPDGYSTSDDPQGVELRSPDDRYPPLRLALRSDAGAGPLRFANPPRTLDLAYALERSRGYDSVGRLYTRGAVDVPLRAGDEVTLVASTEPWERIEALATAEARALDDSRRLHLIREAHPALHTGIGAELVLAADQFIITPHMRPRDETRLDAEGDAACTIIAGYPWFTDWGRDTMISLEGLTLVTGRHKAARDILHTFAHHVRDGLIPNMFPEGETEGLYHTADATLWFFHALDRYEHHTGDVETRWLLLPRLVEIVAKHLEGTRFGIGIDPADGLLRQGAAGYQLTWMDAKVEDWVVTPRRGKPVEINALFYNALRLLERWLRDGLRQGGVPAHGLDPDELGRRADALRIAFNQRFWYADGGYLYDVVDAEGGGNDASFRPNQVLAIALPNPILDRERWRPVLEQVSARLCTPYGLRSLAPGHPDYKPRYDGDLRARDAAYHQGTVWGWLMGPFIDAWLRTFPDDREGARRLLAGLDRELNEACVGTISEIFDAEPPFTPRGCVAQAWSVAEALRAEVLLGQQG
jgi:predicted glycogen debranching enzyme